MNGPDAGALAPGAIAGVLSGGILGAAASAYDTYQTQKTSKRNVDKTIAANKAEAELAYQREIEFWNMQNMYNSPEAQMARFRAAGLNPHLIYGQGTPGNAQSAPSYEPPHAEYRYAPPTYGASIQSILPTLMAVGTWMQNMRLSEADLQNKQLGAVRSEEIIEQMRRVNPHLFQQAANKTALQNYSFDAAILENQKVAQMINEMRQKFRVEYGEDLFQQLPKSDYFPSGQDAAVGGVARLKWIEKEAEARLKQAQASWTDFGITSPQALVQLVLGSVMGMAGQQLKLRGAVQAKPSAKPIQRPRGLVRRRMSRNHPDR